MLLYSSLLFLAGKVDNCPFALSVCGSLALRVSWFCCMVEGLFVREGGGGGREGVSLEVKVAWGVVPI